MKHLAVTLVKFKALQRLLNAPLCHAVGYLETLWIFAQLQARDGDLTKYSALEIAGWVEYPGDPDEFIEALVKTRWLDRVGDRLMIHDWDEHKPNWLKGVGSRSTGPGSGPGPEPGYRPSSAPGSEPTPPPPKPKPSLSLAKPNETMPSLAKPSLESDCGDACGERADLDFLRLGEDKIRDVLRQSMALDKTFGKSIEPAELVWQLAWVGYACGEGVIPGCIEKFKKLKGTTGAVKSPQAWLIGCLNRELKKSEITFDEAVCFVLPWSDAKASVQLSSQTA
jgi:hypothetical protein